MITSKTNLAMHSGFPGFTDSDVKIYKINKDLPDPNFATKGSRGIDLYVSGNNIIWPNDVTLVPLGVSIEYSDDFTALVLARSSIYKLGCNIPNGLGLIDQDYNGRDDELKIPVHNFSMGNILLEEGIRIAQLLIIPRVEFSLQIINNKSKNPNRGGFGSTG